ncbi:MAG: PHP-associated domain-containing protein [Spirochaetota bacterium]
MISLLAAYNVPVTLGSDAHSPADVGRDFDRALSQLRTAGFSEVSYFTKRKREVLPL